MPAHGEPVSIEKLRWAGAITGGLVAVGMTAFTAWLQFVPEDDWTATERVVTYLPMAATGLASSFLTTVAFFDLFVRVPMHPALGAVAGLGAGALEGALIGGTTFGAYMVTATFFDPGFANEAPTIYQSGWMGLSGGATFGALIGAVPGAVAGLVLSLLQR